MSPLGALPKKKHEKNHKSYKSVSEGKGGIDAINKKNSYTSNTILYLSYILRGCIVLNQNLTSSPGYHPVLDTVRLAAVG